MDNCLATGADRASVARAATAPRPKTHSCPTCQYYSSGACRKAQGLADRPLPCSQWEQRREVAGMTIWELLDREG